MTALAPHVTSLLRSNSVAFGRSRHGLAHAGRLGCAGIVSKDRSRPHKSRPSKTWIKVKNPEAPGVRRSVRRFEDRG